MSDVQIHWFSIVNSVVVVFFLSGMTHFMWSENFFICIGGLCGLTKCFSVGILSMIIIRTLRKDIANYNREDDIVRCCWLISSIFWYHLYDVILVRSLSFCNRRTRWRNLVGRTFMVTCSDLLSIPWFLVLCWALVSSCSAWFLLWSVSITPDLQTSKFNLDSLLHYYLAFIRMVCVFCSCGYAGYVVSFQSRSSDDDSLLPFHVHGVNT